MRKTNEKILQLLVKKKNINQTYIIYLYLHEFSCLSINFTPSTTCATCETFSNLASLLVTFTFFNNYRYCAAPTDFGLRRPLKHSSQLTKQCMNACIN